MVSHQGLLHDLKYENPFRVIHISGVCCDIAKATADGEPDAYAIRTISRLPPLDVIVSRRRVLINKTISTDGVYQELVYVGKPGQGMRCCKCASNAIYIGVCDTRVKNSLGRMAYYIGYF